MNVVDARAALTPDYCDCNYAPVRGVEAKRHLPSCRYGIIEDFLDSLPPSAQDAALEHPLGKDRARTGARATEKGLLP